MGEVTLLIERAREGSREAFDRIFELLYPELRQIAHRRLALNSRDGLIDTTALVNECYLKFSRHENLKPADRSHFLAYSAAVMRSIVVDAARSARSERRGSGADPVTLDTALMASVPAPEEEILDVHAALDELAKIDGRLSRRRDALFRRHGRRRDRGGAGLVQTHGEPRLGQGAAAAGARAATLNIRPGKVSRV